ncbi:MAG: hypothetical protein Kow00122_08380 [Thermoleophilia bacterium]
MLVSLFFRYMPHDYLAKAGLSCQMENGCGTTLPIWADAAFSFLVGGMILGLLLFAAYALHSQLSCSGRRCAELMRSAAPLDSQGLSARLRGRVFVVEDPAPVSFVIGFLRPRVIVSTGLLAALDPVEVEAVLAHEEGHVASRDNLMILVAQTVAMTFALVPGSRLAFARLRRAQEIAADAYARAQTGDGLVVASSLQKFARSLFAPVARPALSAGFADEGHVTERIRGLLVEEIVRPSRRYLAVAVLGFVLLFSAFVGSALAFTGVTLASESTCSACHGPTAAVGTDAAVHGTCSREL